MDTRQRGEIVGNREAEDRDSRQQVLDNFELLHDHGRIVGIQTKQVPQRCHQTLATGNSVDAGFAR